MTTYPQVQFVTAPETGATVLFDFNDQAAVGARTKVLSTGFTLGTAQLLGNPDGLGVEYGPRTMAFTLSIRGTRGQALAAQATLARTFMLRRRGWLRVQLDAIRTPVWLRTYTPTPGELDFDLVSIDNDEDAWRIGVQVAAEPLMRGEWLTLGTWTINNNPAHGTNPMSVTLPAVIGDAPAPLRIKSTFSADRSYRDVMWATSAVPAAFTPVFWQIGTSDVWTAGLNTGGPEVVSTYSGNSARRVSFGTPAMNLRLSGVAPTSPPAGRYRLFLRVERTGTAAAHYKFQAAFTVNGADLSPAVSWNRAANTSGTLSTWVDLGSFDLPLPIGDTDLPIVASVPTLRLYVEKVSGASDLMLDCFALVPESLTAVTSLEAWEKSSMLVTEFGDNAPSATNPQVWDGDSESTLRVVASGVVDSSIAGPMRGRFPTVSPGVSNLLTMFQQVRVADPASSLWDNTDAIADSASVEVSYQPRHLWLGEG